MSLDPTKLFNGNDDLYKFLVIGGVFLFVFGLMYPLEKEKELKLKINEHNSTMIEIEYQDSILNQNYIESSKTIDLCYDTAKALLEKGDTSKAQKIKSRVETMMSSIEKFKTTISQSKRKLKAKQNEVEILETYYSKYNAYSLVMLWLAPILFLIGILFWFHSQRLTLKQKEYSTDIRKVERDKTVKNDCI